MRTSGTSGRNGGHGDVFELDAGLLLGRPLVRPVRIVTAKPEAERLALGDGLEERREVLELWSGRVPRPPGPLNRPRPPALAGVSDDVPFFLQKIGIGLELCIQSAVQIGAVFEPVGHLSGECRSAGRSATGGGDEGVGEQDALLGK